MTYQRACDVPDNPLEVPGEPAEITEEVTQIPLRNPVVVRAQVAQKAAQQARYNPPAPAAAAAAPPIASVTPFPPTMWMAPRMPMYNQNLLMNSNTKPINFRTEACKNFHSPAGCTHGDNCHFIHDLDYDGRPIPNMAEWRKSNPTRLRNLEIMKSMQMGLNPQPPISGANQQPGAEPAG